MKRTLFFYYEREKWDQHKEIDTQIEELKEKRRRLEMDAKQNREEYLSQFPRDVEELCKVFRQEEERCARIVLGPLEPAASVVLTDICDMLEHYGPVGMIWRGAPLSEKIAQMYSHGNGPVYLNPMDGTLHKKRPHRACYLTVCE